MKMRRAVTRALPAMMCGAGMPMSVEICGSRAGTCTEFQRSTLSYDALQEYWIEPGFA